MTLALPLNLRDPEAIILPASGGFSTTLSPTDRKRLHQVIRRVHLRHFPKDAVTDYECDKLLDAWGPRVQETLLRQAVDAGFLK